MIFFGLYLFIIAFDVCELIYNLKYVRVPTKDGYKDIDKETENVSLVNEKYH